MKCEIVRELDSLERVLRQKGRLNCAVLQGLDLRKAKIDWPSIECDGAIFLGCQFPDEVTVTELWGKGAMIFPAFNDLPYNPYRPQLYTRAELMAGWTPDFDGSVDKQIYDHFVKHGRKDPDVVEALAERLHDHAIDDALSDLLEGRVEGDGRKKVVAIMGGHGTSRADPFFHKVAHLARRLTEAGYYIATGGGPGMMEAGNLGAHLAGQSALELDEVLLSLEKAPFFVSEGYVEAANAVLKKYPRGHSSLAVPTWFYGHEPTNVFAAHIAKYFSNSIREDGLLAIAEHGVIFSPGSAGTTQEIFQDATQNHYATFGHVTPMVFLGKQRYAEETQIFSCLSDLARSRDYADMLLLSDEVHEIMEFINKNPPRASLGGVKTPLVESRGQ